MEALAGIRCVPFALGLTARRHSPSLSSVSFHEMPTPFFRTPARPLTVQKRRKTSPVVSTAQGTGFQAPRNSLIQYFDNVIRVGGVLFTVTAVFLGCFCSRSLANPLPSAPAVEAAENETEEEKERFLEEYLEANPDDADGLKALVEVKVRVGKLQEAISVVDRLAKLRPGEKEWPLTRAHLRRVEGDVGAAREEFEAILTENPLLVDAYHGLMITAAQSESLEELEEISKRIETKITQCQKEKRTEELRDFRLLMAQIKVIEGRYEEALGVYKELVKQEPRDFRPYLCEGIIYTLMRKKDDAEKQFEKYRRLVPKGHPYGRHIDEHILATKIFSQMGGNRSDRR